MLKLITISECVKTVAVYPPMIAEKISCDVSTIDEKITLYPIIERGEESVKHNILTVIAKSFFLIVFVFTFSKSVFQKPYAICNKNNPANNDKNINTDFGIAEITAFAQSAPVVINTISPIIHPKMQKKPVLYPPTIDRFAVVKNTGPTDINTKKHKQNVLKKI